jgi:hypothetical protein
MKPKPFLKRLKKMIKPLMTLIKKRRHKLPISEIVARMSL